MKRILFLLPFLLAACTPAGPAPTPTPELPPLIQPYAPRPGDSSLSRGNLYLDSAELLVLESYPVQINLVLQGNLPTPCHELRVSVTAPDNENRILVEAYSLSDPQAICMQVLQPFEASIPLGSFPAGHYSVWVNGEKIGEFDA